MDTVTRDYNAEHKNGARKYAYEFDSLLRRYMMRALDPFMPPGKALEMGCYKGEVTEMLAAHGYRAHALHGGLSQEQRDRVMRRFRDGTVELLVATDVAARGLDIRHVSHVVNYDVPSSPDGYVHRVGRTGRAGRAGVAITFAEPKEHRQLRNIEQLTKQKIEIQKVPTIVDLRARKLELTRAAIQETLLAGELDAYRLVVESLGSEHDLFDIAAAAVKLAQDARNGADKADVEIPTLRMVDGGKRKERKSPRVRTKRTADTDASRLYIGIGRSSGMRPADIVGAIANEAGVNPREIGAIDIADKFSIVEVSADDVKSIIAALRNTTLRGKRVTVREDRER